MASLCKSHKSQGQNMCPDEEKGCSARDLVKVKSCRGEDLLSNGIKHVMIG